MLGSTSGRILTEETEGRYESVLLRSVVASALAGTPLRRQEQLEKLLPW
jgi:hypothetical protein